jgi:putative intracellular protease/amidase
MKEVKKQIVDKELTRRNFLKGGAGAVLAAGCLTTLGFSVATRVAHANDKIYVCTPCGLDCDKLEFDKPGVCPACGMALIEKAEADKTVTVAILLFDRVEIIDFAGPWEVFGGAGFKVHTVAEKTEPVNTVYGQKVLADYTFDNSPKADILLVPGGGVGNAVNNPRLINWLQANAQAAKYVMSVCTGAFLLGKAGLLDGLTATTVRGGIDQLATYYPKTKVVHDQRWVDNGRVITTAGLSSGIDGALHLVEKILGRGDAEEIALGIEYRWEPELKYARAALADRYLPNFKGFAAKTLSVGGDTEHWELRALVWSPATAAEIVELTNKQLVASTPHTRSAVTLLKPQTKSSAAKAETRWQFTDEQGRDWHGVGVAEPSPDEKGKFIVTLKLAQAQKSAAR